jgi:hypothetical protein
MLFELYYPKNIREEKEAPRAKGEHFVEED